MPDLTNATTVKRVKRGYRRISMTLKLGEYDLIAQMAEAEDRTPDQQALHMLRRLLQSLQVEAIKNAYTEAAARRESYNGEVVQGDDGDGEEEEDGEEEDAPDPHGIELGEVNRSE